MKQLWTPWRYDYVSGVNPGGPKGVPAELSAWPGDLHCVFCNMLGATAWAVEQGMDATAADKAANIVDRGAHSFLVLNAFPYNSGHVMAVPYRHEHSLAALDTPTTAELMSSLRRSEKALRAVYHPNGINMGLNLGEAAGAGVAEHLHFHVVPRWSGDTNYMTVLAQTRVLPEMLDQAWTRLREALHVVDCGAKADATG